jgi:predicted exporter
MGVAAILAISQTQWPEQGWLAADFQALLPASSSSKWTERASREASSAYDRQVLWLVEGDDSVSVRNFLTIVLARLDETGYSDPTFERVQAERWSALSAALYPHRWGLLSAADRAELERDPAAYFLQFRRLLYSPLGGQPLSMLEVDPTGLFGRFLQAAAPVIDMQANSVAENGPHSELAVVSIHPERLGFDALAGLYDLFHSLRDDARARGLKLHVTGVPLYSAYGVHSAKLEMSTIGIASLVLLVSLLLWVLRSATAVLLTLLCVLSGVAGGFVTTVVVLQEIHILTLVFGATLIGIAADYALHYFAHALLPGWSPESGLARVYRGLLFGMLSSVVAFTALIALPFPGIRQIGLFMASGLICSFITVCLLFPVAFRRASNNRPLPTFCRRQQRVWRGSIIPVVAVIFAALLGLILVPGVDDVRDFYSAPSDLAEAELAIEQAMQTKPDSRYFLLQGSDKSELFELESRVMVQLELLRKQGVLGNFFAISQLIPATRTQRESNALMRRVAAQGHLTEHMQTLGFGSPAVQASGAALLEEFTPVGVETLERLELPLGIAGFLGCDESGCASWIRLSSIHSPGALQMLEDHYSGLRLIDPIDDINAGINKYRTAVGAMLIAAVLITLGFLSLVCGWQQALRIVFLPILTCLLALLVTGLLRGSYTIVNLMALLLVLGVSLDYAIFRAFTQPAEQSATTLAIALSAVTSILAFGMLSFSSTPAISSFGQTIALGLLLAYCLSWLRFEERATR